jgi:hypothetical protein
MSDAPIGDQDDTAEQQITEPQMIDSGDSTQWSTARLEPPLAAIRAGARRSVALALQMVSLALLVAVVATVIASRQLPQRVPQTAGQTSAIIQIGLGGETPTPGTAFVGPPIGPMPTVCNTSPTRQPVGPPTAGNAVGADPVWVDGFDGATAAIDIAAHATGPYTSRGWPVLIVLAFKHPFSAKVALEGESLPAQTPLWLSFQGPNGGTPPSVGFTMDPQEQQNLYPSGDSTAAFWFGSLFLPGAGCYALDARWDGSNWRAIFAAGHQ